MRYLEESDERMNNLPDEPRHSNGPGGCFHPDMERCFRTGALYSLQIEATDVCQQHCIYCYARGAEDHPQSLDSDVIRELLRDVRELGGLAVDWLGGDPLLAPDGHALMMEARGLGLRNNIWTSGIPLGDPEVARQVAAATGGGGFVSLHLDSLDPGIYSLLHEGPARTTMDAILSGLENLQAAGKPAGEIINCITWTRLQPLEDLENTIRWFRQEKGMETCLVLFKPAGSGGCFKHLIPSADAIQSAYTIRNRWTSGPVLGSQDVSKFYCGTKCCVTFQGEVTPCSLIRSGPGNIFDRPFRDILREHREALLLLRLHHDENLPRGCRRCPHHTDCWGCRANAYYYSGDIHAPDPECWLNPDRAASAQPYKRGSYETP